MWLTETYLDMDQGSKLKYPSKSQKHSLIGWRRWVLYLHTTNSLSSLFLLLLLILMLLAALVVTQA